MKLWLHNWSSGFTSRFSQTFRWMLTCIFFFTSFFSLPFMESGGVKVWGSNKGRSPMVFVGPGLVGRTAQGTRATGVSLPPLGPGVLSWVFGKTVVLLVLESFGVCISRYWYCCVSRRCIRGTQKRCYMLILSIFAGFFPVFSSLWITGHHMINILWSEPCSCTSGMQSKRKMIFQPQNLGSACFESQL